MTKTDVKKTIDAYRAPRGEFRIVDVPDMQYLMVDGHGDPNTSPAFTEAIDALYPVAYKLKFASKQDLGHDYVVPPLEGLWWTEDMDAFTEARDKSQWDWTLMTMVPDWIDQGRFTTAVAGRGQEPASAPGHGLRMEGTHHEIYLSDFRKVTPDERRTILRQPVSTDTA